MNENIKKDKYQMPNLDDLMCSLAETITSDGPGNVWFTTVDLKYAFGQVLLNPSLAKHCNFAIVGGKAICNRILWVDSNAHRISKNNGKNFN